MRSKAQPSIANSARRYDLDWLRVLAILAVFVFHSGRFFDQGDWHVKNATTYLGVQIWTTFLANWIMPLIFVISGASTFYALGTRGAGRFIKDRALRLLVPLVVGIFTHVLVQVYLERISHHQFNGSLWAFIPHYFDGMYAFGGNFAWMGLHLWYLEILFVFSVLLLPLFTWLRHGGGQRVATRLTSLVAQPLAVYLPALPIMVLAILGFGMRYLNVNAPWLRDANEAVLPFYVLHQSVLIYVGYFVVQWAVPDPVKWLIIAPTSFVIIVALYELLVRRVPALRFLFGMKPAPQPRARPFFDQRAHV